MYARPAQTHESPLFKSCQVFTYDLRHILLSTYNLENMFYRVFQANETNVQQDFSTFWIWYKYHLKFIWLREISMINVAQE